MQGCRLGFDACACGSNPASRNTGRGWFHQQLLPPSIDAPHQPLLLATRDSLVALHCVVDGSGRAHRLILSETPSRQTPLTAREREIAVWLQAGKTNGEIADILGVRSATVKNHIAAILEKLSVPNRTAAVRILAGYRASPGSQA